MKQNGNVKLSPKIFGWFGGDGSHHLRLYVEKAQEVCSSCSALSDQHVCENNNHGFSLKENHCCSLQCSEAL